MATKPERFSEEWVALIEQGIPSYPGDLEVIDIVRSQGWEGFWEVSEDDVVDPKANRLKQDQEMEAQLRAQQDRMMGADNQALQFHMERGGQTPSEAESQRAARLGRAARSGQEEAMDYIRAIQQAHQYGAYDPSLQGVDQEAAAMATEGNLAVAPQTQQFTPHLPAGWDQMFTPGQDMGLVDPNQAYPGSVRRGVAGPVTEGEKKKTSKIVETITQVDDPTISDKRVIKIDHGEQDDESTWDKFKGLLFDKPEATQLGDSPYADTMITDQQVRDEAAAVEAAKRQRASMGVGPTGDIGLMPKDRVQDIIDESKATLEAEKQPVVEQTETVERINPISLRERYPTTDDYINQIRENQAAREEGRESEVLSKEPIVQSVETTDPVGVTVDETGLVGQALKEEDEAVTGLLPPTVRDPQDDQLKFPRDAEAMGVATEMPEVEVAVEDAKDGESTVSGKSEEALTTVQRDELERAWGQYTWDPKARKDRFTAELDSITRKAAWLDAIAALTGAPSRSAQYMDRAIRKMEALMKFDQEERVYNIWRDVYFVGGVYDPPKSKREAADRARKLGARPDEVAKIFGWAQEGEDLQQWWRLADNEQGYEVTQIEGKKKAPDEGDGLEWQQGSVPTTLSGGGTANRVYWRSEDGKHEVLLGEGTTPESLGYGAAWSIGRKDKAEGKIPGGEDDIDFIEQVYANNNYGESGFEAAVVAMMAKMKKDPETYGIIGEFIDDQHRASAEAIVKSWIDAYENRGRKSFSSQGRAAGGGGTVSLGSLD